MSSAGKIGTQPHPLLRTGPVLVLLLLVSLFYNWYYLGGDFQADEYFFLNMLRQDPAPYSRWLGFWAVDDVPAITNMWWFEGGGVGVFWRPLPSLLLEASIRVFGEHPFPLHLLSIVIHGLVGGTLFLLLRRLTGRPLAALLAGLLFLSCEDHSMGIGWIATMTDLICVLCVNLALLAHTLWLEQRQPWALPATLAALALALLSKESAVVAPLAIVLMTLFMPRGRESMLPVPGRPLRQRAAGFVRDWLSWMPAVILLAAYLALYKLLGFGRMNGGLYVDPFSNPGRYIAHLIENLPIMWLATLSPVPPSLGMFVPQAVRALVVAGTAVFIVWAAGLWYLRRSRVAGWALTVYILALLPQMSAGASERALYFPSIGASILLALFLVQIGPIARRTTPTARRAPALTRIVGWAVLLGILLPGAFLSATMPFMYLPSFERPNKDAASIVSYVERRAPDYVLVLNTPGLFHTFYIPPIVEYLAGRSVDVRVLSSMNGIVSAQRINEKSFVLRVDRKGWLTNFFADMLRSSAPLRRGKVYHKGILTATLLELTPTGRDVLAVRFDLNRPLNSPDILLVQWDGEIFRPIDLATLPPGQVVTLADSSDVWASMW